MLKKIFNKFTESLQKTNSKVSEGIKGIFFRKKLDETALEDLEDLLISADMGVKAVEDIIQKVSKLKFKKDATEDDIKEVICQEVESILCTVKKEFAFIESKPQVLLFCGTNGNGKTTTIGKLAYRLKKEGKKVMIAACDTFRAAAIEQLQAWAVKAGCEFFADHTAKDPASVAYKSINRSAFSRYRR